jgi:hypothetical protein
MQAGTVMTGLLAGPLKEAAGLGDLIEELPPAGWEWIAAYRHWAR